MIDSEYLVEYQAKQYRKIYNHTLKQVQDTKLSVIGFVVKVEDNKMRINISDKKCNLLIDKTLEAKVFTTIQFPLEFSFEMFSDKDKEVLNKVAYFINKTSFIIIPEEFRYERELIKYLKIEFKDFVEYEIAYPNVNYKFPIILPLINYYRTIITSVNNHSVELFKNTQNNSLLEVDNSSELIKEFQKIPLIETHNWAIDLFDI